MKLRNLTIFLMGYLAFLLFIIGCSKPVVKAHEPFKFYTWVQGKSMLPTFPEEKTLILAQSTPYSDLHVHDTVIRWNSATNCFIHHRIVSKESQAYYTQGDNLETNRTTEYSLMGPDDYICQTITVAPLVVWEPTS